MTESLFVSLLISLILLIAAGIAYLWPQTLSTLSESQKKNLNLDWRAIRRISAGGLALLAATISVGSWLLIRSGIEETTITVLRIVVLFIGTIAVVAAVESRKRPKS